LTELFFTLVDAKEEQTLISYDQGDLQCSSTKSFQESSAHIDELQSNNLVINFKTITVDLDSVML
jgi:hypothetical protein